MDFERAMLFLPDSKTGRKPILLNAPAMEVIASLPRMSAYVIAGNDPGKPRADLHRPWKLIAERAGLGDVRLHDLRHTFASFGAGSGLGLPMIGKLLGHRQAYNAALRAYRQRPIAPRHGHDRFADRVCHGDG